MTTNPAEAAVAYAAISGSNRITYREERRNEDGTLTTEAEVTLVRHTDGAWYDLNRAWRFVVDSYDEWPVNRREWTDGDILAFANEYHINGLAEFRTN